MKTSNDNVFNLKILHYFFLIDNLIPTNMFQDQRMCLPWLIMYQLSRIDGVWCTNVKECKGYTKEQCSTSISPRSPFKCKLDGQTCRDMQCIEADTKLNTDQACNEWPSGCKSTGMGCIDILPSCVTYSETATTCPNMRGIEGICDFDNNTGKCKARICTNALSTLKTDTECNQYKPRCVTTGKGCIDILKGCSSYQGNTQTCEGYVGTDGLCTGDENGTQCRQRECKDKQSNSNQDCNTWKSGCVTNVTSNKTITTNCQPADCSLNPVPCIDGQTQRSIRLVLPINILYLHIESISWKICSLEAKKVTQAYRQQQISVIYLE